MSNSSLVNYTRLSPNHDNGRGGNRISKITIHHMAGNLSVETCGAVFAPRSRQASSNYGVDSNGRVGLYVEEKNRSWCTANRANDNVAVTIEVANDQIGGQWHVSDKALAKTIDLCVDICRRNGIRALNYTGNKSGNLTKHEWFANTNCPGPYLGSKFPYIANEVNKRLGQKPIISIDGIWGANTTSATQRKLGTPIDGIVSSQAVGQKKYILSIVPSVWQFVSNPRGSQMVIALQKLVGAKADGLMGYNTIKAMQTWLNKRGYNAGAVDGYMGKNTVSAWQKYLNA